MEARRAGRADTAGRVAAFGLYGEDASAPDTEFLHIEDIHSRSSLHAWEIGAHTHRGLFQVVVLLEGGARVRLDDRTLELAPQGAVVVPPAVVHGFQFQPGSHGYVLTVAEAVLFDGARAHNRPLVEGLFLAACVVDLAADAPLLGRVAALLEQLMAEFRQPQLGQTMMCVWLSRSVLLLLERRRAAVSGATGPERVRTELFARFRTLVEEHHTEHWPVPRYAAALGITESRLNRLCRRLADRSAFEVVQDRLLLEARRRLIYIAAPVSVIAYELGFQDPGYFNRFFKKLTGTTPAAFRRQARGAEE
ncbi:helix-turn-helix domain-containing protein [Azospirillum agricola]|uniref:helix-turn-helix domain-containing protein n=1 Tax=Azospirillum agricola TaxID=1720247 RepID=UPI000A0EFDF4|nr:helix-turn-helix domain-containing protein [Azospirillum agricola]SMH61921.1 transcriptional regulator, AraC family [Azospirillum lipoferum]